MKLVKHLDANNETPKQNDEDASMFQSFRNLTPLAFLAVNHISEGAIEKVCKTFELKEYRGKRERLVYFLDESPEKNHKEQSVHLMGAALFIANLFPAAEVLLTSENRFKNSLLDGMEIEGAELKEDLAEKWLESGAKFTISSEAQTYLHQAGFDFVIEDSDKNFTRDEVIKQIQNLVFASSAEQTASPKRKGA